LLRPGALFLLFLLFLLFPPLSSSFLLFPLLDSAGRGLPGGK